MGTAYGRTPWACRTLTPPATRSRPPAAAITREAGPVKGSTTVIAFVTDPDGYKIELIQRADDDGPGSALTEAPVLQRCVPPFRAPREKLRFS